MSELKNCPFCGANGKYISGKEIHSSLDDFLVVCSNDKCKVFHYLFTDVEWQSRPGEQAARGEALEEASKLAEDHTWDGVPGGAQAVMDKIIELIGRE